jgi:hypothetical protein
VTVKHQRPDHPQLGCRGLLLDALVGEAVAASPEGTLRTGFALRIVNAFFVRAADDFVDGGRGFDVVSFEEGRDE